MYQKMIKIISTPISKPELKAYLHKTRAELAKAVVDIELGIMAIGGDLHADEEAVLLENGSQQENLWGINIYPDSLGEEMIEFDSMINLRPRQNNRTRGVENEELRKKIIKVVNKLINE